MSSSTSASAAARLVEPFQSELTRLLQELVRTDTVAIPPNGGETAGQHVLQSFLAAHGIPGELYECDNLIPADHPYRRPDRNLGGRRNLVLRIAGSGGGRSLLLSGHMDTVPPGHDPWTESPWSGAIHGDRLYGRGSFDMKGGLAALFTAACALHKAGVRLAGDLICESVIDEEWGGGAGTLAGRLRGDVADACLIPEGTHLEVALATRGGAIVDLVCRAGDPESYFAQEEVVSPAFALGRLLAWIEDWSRRRQQVARGDAYAAFPDPAPVQIMAVEANRLTLDVPLSVPLTASVRFYMQFLPHENPEEVLAEVRRSFDDFVSSDRLFSEHRPEWRPLFHPPLWGHELPPAHPWSRCMLQCASQSLGAALRPTAAPYPCDAFLMQRHFGIPAILFGPTGGGAHNADEYVDLPSVMKTTEVLTAAALDWCGG
jgi:acetylornithine deacetylase